MKILVICGSGISTSIMCESMMEHCEEEDRIKASSIGNMERFIKDFDVVIVAPQVDFARNQISDLCKKYNKPFAYLGEKVFGTMDGKAALKIAQDLMENIEITNEKPSFMVTFICTASLSSTYIANKIEKKAQEKGFPISCKAFSANSIMRGDTPVGDLICLTPQTAYYYDDIQLKFPNKTIYLIDFNDFALLNIDNVFMIIEDLMNKRA